MTLGELKNWIKSSELVDEITHWDDNQYISRIYKKGDGYFVVEFCNGHPTEKFGDKGYERWVYELVRVVPKMEIVERHFWLTNEGHEIT